MAAGIDCGTNSIRLLIADVTPDGLVDVDRRMRVVRLGQGVDATGRLAPEALERTFAAARTYAEAIRGGRRGPDPLRRHQRDARRGERATSSGPGSPRSSASSPT